MKWIKPLVAAYTCEIKEFKSPASNGNGEFVIYINELDVKHFPSFNWSKA
jgi:hypothetical protein